MESKTLYVRVCGSGLHDEAAIGEELRAAGATVKKVTLIRDGRGGPSKGFGFVDVADIGEDLAAIMEKVNARAKLFVNDSPRIPSLPTPETAAQPSMEEVAENPETPDDELMRLMEVGDEAVRSRAIVNIKDMGKLKTAIDQVFHQKKSGWSGVLMRIALMNDPNYPHISKEMIDYAFGKVPKEDLEDMGY